MASQGTRRQAHFSGAVTAGTSTTTLRPAEQGRMSIRVTNDGATDAYLQYEVEGSAEGAIPTAVVGSGVYLKAAGGTHYDENYTGAIACIAKTTATNLAVVEV